MNEMPLFLAMHKKISYNSKNFFKMSPFFLKHLPFCKFNGLVTCQHGFSNRWCTCGFRLFLRPQFYAQILVPKNLQIYSKSVSLCYREVLDKIINFRGLIKQIHQPIVRWTDWPGWLNSELKTLQLKTELSSTCTD